MLKLKRIASIGICHIIRHQLHNKLFYINKFKVRHMQSFNIQKDLVYERIKHTEFWNFELRTRESINVPIWIFVDFQQMDEQSAQNLNNDTFYRPPVTSAHVVIGTKMYPGNSLSLNYEDDDYSQ